MPAIGTPIDVRAVEVFVTVAEERHFGRAARRTGVSQPAISRHISQLEARLGVSLLRRSNRRVDLTPEGVAFLQGARDMLAALRRAADVARLASAGAAGTLRFGSAGTYSNQLAASLVYNFRRVHSAVEVLVSQSSYVTRPAAGLDQDLVEVALVRGPLAYPGLEFEPLVADPRVLATSARHRLAARPSALLPEIEGEPIVSSRHWPQRVRDYWAGVDEGLDPAYNVSVLAVGPGEWLGAIAEDRGVSLCPASIADYYSRDDLAYIPVEGIEANPIGLAWRSDALTPLLRNFIDYARAYAATFSLG